MNTFGIVVIVVSLGGAVIAVLSSLRAGHLYQEIGRLGDLWLETSEGAGESTRELVREEVRQMRQAISAKREARGEPPLSDDEEAIRGHQRGGDEELQGRHGRGSPR